MAKIAVLMVGFQNPEDFATCFRALAKMQKEPSFDVFVCENGGPAAFSELIKEIEKKDLCTSTPAELPTKAPESSLATHSYRLAGRPETQVFLALAPNNLGYAGGVNFWLRPLLSVSDWDGIWLLNPDTEPLPDSLAELFVESFARYKGMIAGCLVQPKTGLIANCGLQWRPWKASPRALGRLASLKSPPTAAAVEARLTAPSGASMYVDRRLITRIGLMEESYFLYFEDLEWGLRALRLGEVAYASGSVVYHTQGTTIGSSASRKNRSSLSVYLSARNTILFVRRNFPLWLPWTVLMQCIYLCTYIPANALNNFSYGLRGLWAGLLGRAGRPEITLDSGK